VKQTKCFYPYLITGIKALEEIVGVDRKGDEIHEKRSKTEQELRAAGDLWSEHILENAKVGRCCVFDLNVSLVKTSNWYYHLVCHFSGVYYEFHLCSWNSHQWISSNKWFGKSSWNDWI